MGCNTSKDGLPVTDKNGTNENGLNLTSLDGKNTETRATGEGREKPPSARTITLKSAHHNETQSNHWHTEEGQSCDLTAEEEEAATKIQAVFRGHQARKTMKREDKSANASRSAQENSDLDDQPELENAATKIQASFRGHMVRKQMGKNESNGEPSTSKPVPAEEEELDIDLTDPDLHKAATRIQATFRGHITRK